jgi:hypothetical protein
MEIPILVLERELLPYWGGTDNIGGIRPQRADAELRTDYQRACNIRDFVAPLKVHAGSGIVFSGDDLGLGLERQSGSLFFAVRIYYEIDNLDDHIGFAKDKPDCFKKDFESMLSSGKVIVFDSVFTGVEVRDNHGEVRRNYLEIGVEPGLYDVLTYEQKIQEAEIVLYKFQLRRGM